MSGDCWPPGVWPLTRTSGRQLRRTDWGMGLSGVMLPCSAAIFVAIARSHVNEAIFCSQLDSESALLSSHFPQPSLSSLLPAAISHLQPFSHLFCPQPFLICSRFSHFVCSHFSSAAVSVLFAWSHFSSAAVLVILPAAISHLQLFQCGLPGAISHLQPCQSFCQQPFAICNPFNHFCQQPCLICSRFGHLLCPQRFFICSRFSHFVRSHFSSAAVSVMLPAAISHLQPFQSLQRFLICSRFSHFVRSHFSSAAVSVMLPAAISHLQPFQSFWQQPFVICSHVNHFV